MYDKRAFELDFCTADVILMHENKELFMEKIKFEDALDMVYTNQIDDAKSVIGLLMAKKLIEG